jgi:hypothetical protein
MSERPEPSLRNGSQKSQGLHLNDGISLIRADQNLFPGSGSGVCWTSEMSKVQRRFLMVGISGVAGISAGAVYRVLSLMMAEVKN